ncbi:hypothetical protein H0H92_010811 [Tricholoma furcatifolium]|nr:hypothetical protein H0H92_010811 [Tricholoma furcatifolium]
MSAPFTSKSFPKWLSFEADDHTRYCTLCDEYFESMMDLLLHIQVTETHPSCTPCNLRFLNGNSLAEHYATCASHIYCADCNIHFKSVAALSIHYENSIRHSDDSDDERERETRPPGWEEELAEKRAKEERARQVEESIPEDPSEEAKLTGAQRRQALLNFMARRKRGDAKDVRSYSCPICLASPKDVSATRCGHLFCTP